MRRVFLALSIGVGAMLLAAVAANAAPAGGKIEVLAVLGSGASGTIVITGAIGDYGTTLSMNKNGKPNPNGNYVEIRLQKGSFEVNQTALNAATAKERPTIQNKSTCSFAFIGTGPPGTLFNGTGLYKGISGEAKVTFIFGGIGPRYTSGKHKGQCNRSNSAKPIAQKGWASGPGTVKFG